MRDKYTETVIQAVRECNAKSNIVTKYGVVKISTIYALYDGIRSKNNVGNMPPDAKASIYAPFSLKLSGGG